MDARTRRTLAVMWVGAFLTSASFSLVFPFLPLYLQQIGTHTHVAEWTGVAFAASFFAQAIVSPFWGALADRIGQKPMMLRSAIAIAIVMGGLAMAHSATQVVLWRLANGALSGFIPASSALVVRISPRERLGRSMGFFQSSPAAGAITGPLLGGLLVQVAGIRNTFWIGVAMMLAVTVLTWWGVHEPPIEASARQGRMHPLRDVAAAFRHLPLREVFLLGVVVQTANTAIEPLITLYVQGFPGIGAVPFWSGLLFSLVGMAAVIWAPRWGRLAEARGPGGILRLGCVLAGAGNLLQLVCTSPVTFGATRFVLIGTGYAAVLPCLNLIVARHSAPEFQGRAFGSYNSVQQIGGMLGPLIGGFWGGAFGIRSNFVFTGTLFLAAALGTAHAVRRDRGTRDVLSGATPAAGA